MILVLGPLLDFAIYPNLAIQQSATKNLGRTASGEG